MPPKAIILFLLKYFPKLFILTSMSRDVKDNRH